MKLILSAMALAFAVPAAAQTMPAMDHSQHNQAEHARHDTGHDQHKGHESQSKDMKHECPMTKDGKKMACCEHGHAKGDAPKAHVDHGGH